MDERQENTGEKKGKDTIFYGLNLCQLVKFVSVLRVFLRPCASFVPVLASLLFLGALFWAKWQDPFSRKWFTLSPHLPSASSPVSTGEELKCVAVLPKPIRPCPVVIYAHGSGGSLMNDGFALRQMTEMGLAVVSLEYDQTNDTAFAPEMEAVLQYVAGQKWADTNAIAWVGFSLGANRLLDFALHHPDLQPQLLVQLSGAGIPDATLAMNPGKKAMSVEGSSPSSLPSPPGEGETVAASGQYGVTGLVVVQAGNAPTAFRGIPSPSPVDRRGEGLTELHCQVLLIHGEQDEIFPAADTERFAAMLESNGVPVELKILAGLAHGTEPERGVVFRYIGEYCLAHLAPTSRTPRWWDEHLTPALSPFDPSTPVKRGEGETFPASRQGSAPRRFGGSMRESSGEFSPEWWQGYHSIAQWQAEAPGSIWFWIPAVAWAIGGFIRFRRQRAKAVAQTFLSAGSGDFPVASFPGDGRAEGGGPRAGWGQPAYKRAGMA